MQSTGKVKWQCPSNIALVKYWGKFGRQFPSNPSISFTLNNAVTTTEVNYVIDSNDIKNPEIEFFFEGEAKPSFADKILKYLNSISDELPWLKNFKGTIRSSNSFPHSSGIASSASSMGALALCLLDIDQKIGNSEKIDYRQASHLARLGSGSASRSVFPKLALWGESSSIPMSSNAYAIPISEGINPIFDSFRDDILIVSKAEKSVSSTQGHALMNNNPFSKARFQQAETHLDIIIASMEEGDLETFGRIVEKEAMTLHALMMCSDPPYMLFEPETIKIINTIKSFRDDTGVPVYFTLDAGPNVHLLYPVEFEPIVNDLKLNLRSHCVDGLIIEDGVGHGPQKLS